MAIAMLMAHHSEELKDLFVEKLGKLGISKMKELAFLLSKESDAEKTSMEVFGTDHNEETQMALTQLWKSAKGPGRAIVVLEAQQSEIPSVLIKTAPLVPFPTLPLKVKVDSGNLMARTTVAVLSAKRDIVGPALPLLVPPPSKSLKDDMALEWRKVLIQCNLILKENKAVVPRFQKLYGPNGDLVPGAAYLQVQNDSFRFGSTSPSTILGYLKAAKLLIA